MHSKNLFGFILACLIIGFHPLNNKTKEIFIRISVHQYNLFKITMLIQFLKLIQPIVYHKEVQLQ